MLANSCIICHGQNGSSNGPAIPSIAGLSSEYFIFTMEGFKNGEIPSTVMGQIANGYSTEETQLLADYFSTKTFIKAKQSFDAKLARKGAKLHEQYCEKCHAEGGQSVQDDAGILAGQWTIYLSWALKDFRTNKRQAGKKMQQRLDKLYARKGEQGFTALLHYYSSQQ